MTKFHGKVGFIYTEESALGVWTASIEERKCVGDVIREVFRLEKSPDKINVGPEINNRIAILCDAVFTAALPHIRYIVWGGDPTKWMVKSFEIRPPRVILSIGGVYNG